MVQWFCIQKVPRALGVVLGSATGDAMVVHIVLTGGNLARVGGRVLKIAPPIGLDLGLISFDLCHWQCD